MMKAGAEKSFYKAMIYVGGEEGQIHDEGWSREEFLGDRNP